MRIRFILCCCLVMSGVMTAGAASTNPADYPLRIHVFGKSNSTAWVNRRSRSVTETKGQGHANLFANGEVRAVEFSYTCDGQHLRPSSGFWDTYPAKWKKPNRVLVMLIPVFGKTGKYSTCELNTDVKDYAYNRLSQTRFEPVPPEQFKAWMVQHQYDPEHGKNVPVLSDSDPGSPVPPATTSTPADAPAAPSGTTPPTASSRPPVAPSDK